MPKTPTAQTSDSTTESPAKAESVNKAQLKKLVILDQRIDRHESTSLRARWQFGLLMVAARKGKKQLPKGYMDELKDETGKGSSELGYRMQFAVKYSTEAQLSTVLESCKSWREVVASLSGHDAGAPTNPTKPQPKRLAKRWKKVAVDSDELFAGQASWSEEEWQQMNDAAVVNQAMAKRIIAAYRTQKAKGVKRHPAKGSQQAAKVA